MRFFFSVKTCRKNQFVFPLLAPPANLSRTYFGCSVCWLPLLLDRDKSLVLAEISESRQDLKNYLYINSENNEGHKIIIQSSKTIGGIKRMAEEDGILKPFMFIT